MSVSAVAYKDFLDARRSKLVWFVGAHYALLVVLFFVQVWLGAAEGPATVLTALWNMAFVGAVFVPAIALVAAYLAIAGERESGSIKHLLSTPVSRRDVVFGKYLSRAAIIAASLVVGFAVAAVLAAIQFGSVEPTVFVGVAALTTVYALAYVAVAVGISAATDSRAKAMAGAIGFYFATNLATLFDDVSGLAALEYVLADMLGLAIGEDQILFLGMIGNPTEAYLMATQAVFPAELTERMDAPVAEGVAWYVQPKVAVIVLLGWLALPILVGLYSFTRADLS